VGSLKRSVNVIQSFRNGIISNKREKKMTQTTKHPTDDETNIEDSASGVDAVSDVESQRQLNDLRREYLDDRSDSINQWLVVIGLVLAFFAVAIPVGTGIAAYFAYTQFQRIESEAQEHLDEAKRYASEAAQYLKDIQAQKKIAEEVVSELTSEDISKLIQSGTSEASSEVENLLQKIQQDPGASVIDRAIVEANRLQQEGKVDDAIKKWGSIANISEGIDNDKAAAAFLARGAANSNLGKHDEAISDLNEAIRLNPNLAEAYFTRGFTNESLRKVEEAQTDYQTALKIAEQQENEDLKTTIEESLQRLKNKE
jgi:tetratricopeptide (TPR) repeat protein